MSTPLTPASGGQIVVPLKRGIKGEARLFKIPYIQINYYLNMKRLNKNNSSAISLVAPKVSPVIPPIFFLIYQIQARVKMIIIANIMNPLRP